MRMRGVAAVVCTCMSRHAGEKPDGCKRPRVATVSREHDERTPRVETLLGVYAYCSIPAWNASASSCSMPKSASCNANVPV